MSKKTGRQKLIDWATTVTPEQLKKEFVLFCPSDIGLKEIDCKNDSKSTCEDCWRQAFESEYN